MLTLRLVSTHFLKQP
ncbi:hypothetical protein ACFW04_010842 [Cataglyphis niger]